jgi:hypothetical protein
VTAPKPRGASTGPPPGRSRGLTPGKALLAGVAIVALTYLLVGGPDGGSRASVRVPDESTILRGASLDETMRRYQPVSFSVLSGFDYEAGFLSRDAGDPSRGTIAAPSGAAPGAQSTPSVHLPDAVRSLDGRRVAVRGFMMPIDYDGQGVSRFILNGSYDMCMFGAPVAAPHQWVAVQMTHNRRTAFVHVPIVVLGTLSVGEERREGRVLSLYRLQADAIQFP